MNEKIQMIIDWAKMSPSAFCDMIGIQRSALTHIMNGRNKPSLTLIEKILRKFPEINPDWLILDRGPMLREKTNSENQIDKNETNNNVNIKELKCTNFEQKIKSIILVFDDNTFDELIPRKKV
ncbi:MAG: helix-turn-helix domain-containing protein [Bacteroidales bacterium]|nr:helix-turn-helix domain-containing protein [Bacteroidales bacterium]